MAYTLEQAKRFKQIHELLWKEMAKLYDLYALGWKIGNLKGRAINLLKRKVVNGCELLTEEEASELLDNCCCVGCMVVGFTHTCDSCPIKWHKVEEVGDVYQIAEHDNDTHPFCCTCEHTAYWTITHVELDRENYEYLCMLIADSFMD